MRRVIATMVGLILVGTAYVAADVFDVVPGVLTRAGTPPAASSPALAAAPLPVAETGAAAAPLAPASDAPLPTAAGLAKVLAPLVADRGLRPSVGITVRDALTGTQLYAVGADQPRIPASTAKMLAAAAVLADLDPAATMTTAVVQGAVPNEVVLVAGGDTLLGRGASDPTRVDGRAGLLTLAQQTRDALQAKGIGSVTLRLDLTHAAGPAYAPGWLMPDVAAGATQGVHMIGFADQIPRIGRPSPTNPPQVVAAHFASLLTSLGIKTTVAPQTAWTTPAGSGARLGAVESAPIRAVLSFALDHSDNALAENLCRQAAAAKGLSTTFSSAAGNVVATLKTLGINTAGVQLSDCSGLTHDQLVPVRVTGDVLNRGTTGKDPVLQQVIADLPVAALSGTLTERFEDPAARVAAGIPRAKTGTLTGISGLAGTTVDRDGRLLSYVIVADQVPTSVGTLEARAALDRFVAGLTGCGCP